MFIVIFLLLLIFNLFFPSSCHSRVNVVLLSHVSLRFRWLALLAALELDRVWKWKEQQTLPHPLLLSLMLRLSIQIQIHYLSPHIFSLLPLRQLKILIFHGVQDFLLETLEWNVSLLSHVWWNKFIQLEWLTIAAERILKSDQHFIHAKCNEPQLFNPLQTNDCNL